MADQPGRERRRKVAAVTNALRDLHIELAVLNHRARQRQLFEAFAPVNTRMGGIWDGYADDELDLIADFLTRTVAAGRASADEIG